MLNKLIAASLKYRRMVLVFAIAVIAGSAFLLPSVPLEVFPELKAPTVTIMTEAPGYAPSEVELAVTFPVETAINGLPGIRRVRSSSLVGLSIVWAEFDFDVDIYRARQMISERMANAAGALPDNVGQPQMGPISSVAGEIMLIALTSEGGKVSPLELRRIAAFDLRTRLLAVEGVAQITAMGGDYPEYQINVRPDDLRLYELTLKDVEEAAEAAHAPAGGGFLENVGNRELPLRPLTRATSVDDLGLTVVGEWRGTPITLDKVADIQVAGAPKRGTGSTGGHPAVVLVVQKSPGKNTLELTDSIDRMLDDFEKTVPAGVVVERNVFRQADFVRVAIRNVIHALRDGVIFVVIILFLFLLNLRTTFITLTALPLSIGATLIILDFWGVSLNVMTLAGIAVAVGSLVDDAIVDVENVFRRLRENAALPPESRRNSLQVVYEASVEVRSAIFLATIVIILVFVPLFFLSGIEGRFFRPLGIAYVTSLAASLVVAMTVTPVLCYWLLADKKVMEREEGWLVRRLKALYTRTLELALRMPYLVLGGTAALVVAALAVASTFGSSFLPEFNEGSVTVFLNAPRGTSLEESDRVARHLDRQILKISGVATVTRRTGRAEDDEHAEPVSASEIDVRLNPDADVEAVRRDLVRMFDQTPGMTAQLGGPIAHRLSHILSGTPAAVAIKVFGDDLPTLRRLAKEIEGEMRRIPGVRDLVANREVMSATIPVEFDRRKLAAYSLTPGDAAHQMETAFLGRKVATINEGTARFDVTVRMTPEARSSVKTVSDFLLRGASGVSVPVRAVAKIHEEKSSSIITRENVKRKAVISCNVAEGENLGDLIAAIRGQVDPVVARYPGAFVEYGGQFEAQEEASARILYSSLGVLLVVVLLLYGALRSMRPVLLILLNLPFALLGGVLAVYLDGSPDPIGNLAGLFGRGVYVAPVLSIASLVGFIGLAGISCRNGLLLISHYYHLMEEEHVPKAQAVLQGAQERLVPILMTALSSALALIPIVLARGEIGSELQHPLAVVILGGLISSTFLNLIVLPIGFSLFGGGPRPTGSNGSLQLHSDTQPQENSS
jgi:CzcA family heavy metal efflux pump